MAELRDLVCTDRDLVKPCSIATGENVAVPFDAAFGILRSRYRARNHQMGRISQVRCPERKRGNPFGYPESDRDLPAQPQVQWMHCRNRK